MRVTIAIALYFGLAACKDPPADLPDAPDLPDASDTDASTAADADDGDDADTEADADPTADADTTDGPIVIMMDADIMIDDADPGGMDGGSPSLDAIVEPL